MECSCKGCNSRHKFQVDKKFVETIVDGITCANEKKRDKYVLDHSNLELRDVSNWKVMPHNTKPHKKTSGSIFTVTSDANFGKLKPKCR